MEYQRYTPSPRRDRGYRRRQLRRRRLLALAVVILVVAAIALAVVLVTRGGDGNGTASAGPSGANDTSSGSAGQTASPTPRPTTPPPKVWEASASKPVRVWVGGDSMGGELGWGLGPMLEKTKVLKPVLYYKDSTGICRWDFYDWGDKIASVMRNDKPDAVVLMMGTNDTQSVWQNGKWIAHGDPDWKRVYQKRVSDMTRTAIKAGARRVYWVGMPIMQESWRNPWMKSINKLVQKAVAGVPGARYIDSWALFTDKDGKFVPSLRLGDGVHFTVEGQKIIGKAVLTAIKKDWLPNGVPTPEPQASASAAAI
jgi:uncharacterized protein